MGALTTIHPAYLKLGHGGVISLSPVLSVFAGAVLATVFSVLRVISPKWPVFLVMLATVAVGTFASSINLHEPSMALFNGMMMADPFSSFFSIIFLLSAGLTALISFRYLDQEQLQHPEYYVLLLFSALGMMLMASATDLIVIFISLEIMSLAVYILVGFRRADRRSNEAAMKYFILGSTASAFFLYGSALLYGTTGTTGLSGVIDFIHSHPQGMDAVFTLGVWMVILGFLFKVASVPFHMWMPDVYEGAPAPITGFMTTGLKAAAFATFLRVFVSMGYGRGVTAIIQEHLHGILWVSAVLTMTVGNLVALTQTNLKRMLAYSSIAHSGYLLVGLIAGSGSEQGYVPLLVYLLSYAVMNMGAFAVITTLAEKGDLGLNLHDLSGLAQKRPWLSLSLAIFLFSMAGIPPTAGFAAKYLLFYSAIQAHEIWLVVISVLCSAISVYYYLRVLVYMYMRDAAAQTGRARMSLGSVVAVAAMVVMTLQIGVLPARFIAAAKWAVTSL